MVCKLIEVTVPAGKKRHHSRRRERIITRELDGNLENSKIMYKVKIIIIIINNDFKKRKENSIDLIFLFFLNYHLTFDLSFFYAHPSPFLLFNFVQKIFPFSPPFSSCSPQLDKKIHIMKQNRIKNSSHVFYIPGGCRLE